MFIGIYNKSVIVTYIGVFFSILAINNAINNNIRFGMMFLIFAGICDLFDGKYANLHKRTTEEKAFGVQIDSLADMINFVAAPIILALCLGLNSWYHLVIYGIYGLAGITRLGYFNLQVGNDFDSPVTYYKGLPVTYAALIFPVTWLLSFWLQPNVFQVLYAVVIFVVAVLFIINIRIKKPRGYAYLFFICIAIALTAFIILKGV
jgi:CDP-diacylglycerol--serine O-phosphatidyltransferase